MLSTDAILPVKSQEVTNGDYINKRRVTLQLVLKKMEENTGWKIQLYKTGESLQPCKLFIPLNYCLEKMDKLASNQSHWPPESGYYLNTTTISKSATLLSAPTPSTKPPKEGEHPLNQTQLSGFSVTVGNIFFLLTKWRML